MKAKTMFSFSINYFQIIWKFSEKAYFCECFPSTSTSVHAWSPLKLDLIFLRNSCVAHFLKYFLQLQTIENVGELRAVFASSDGMDILLDIGLRSIPSKTGMTCKQVDLRYLTIFYQHCYCRFKVFHSWVDLFFCVNGCLGCFVYYIFALFVCLFVLIRNLLFPSGSVLSDLPFSPHKLA